MDRRMSLHDHFGVTALDIFGVAIRAVYNAIVKEDKRGLRPRLLVLDGLAALTAAYVALGRNLPSGSLLLDQRLAIQIVPVELRCEDHRNERELDVDMTTPEHLIRRRGILEGEDSLPMSYNIELASTAHPKSGAVSYTFPSGARLQSPAHPAHAPRLPLDIVQGIRRLELHHLEYLGINPTQIAFESLVYLCTLEADEVDEPESFVFCYVLRVIAAFHHESPAGSYHWLDPVAWYVCAMAASDADRAALMHGVRGLQVRTLAAKMAEYEFLGHPHDSIPVGVAQAYSSAFELFGTIIENTVTFLATTPVRSADLARAHTFPFLHDAVPDAVLGSTRSRSSAFTPERRRVPANVLQPRPSSTWPGTAPSSSAEPQEPESMSSFDRWSSDDEPPVAPARKHAMRNILRRGHQRSGSSRSQQ